MAANTAFEITIRGHGAHGAYPHRGVDPVVVAAHIVTGLQTIVGRTVSPVEPAVVTVGHIAAGSATNVIPGECIMRGTLRFASEETGQHLRDSLSRIVTRTAEAHRAEAQPSLRALAHDAEAEHRE